MHITIILIYNYICKESHVSLHIFLQNWAFGGALCRLASWCQRGENRASVLTVFENTHILSVACTSYVTSLGWGVGDVNVYVNLRHMHILRYVTGLGGGAC